ncbi:MAG: Uma2 family endonuclease, partial [Hymenobacter sp.]|nr:Uma2 family endonuclease [Hymenobacter sp.]
FDKAREKLILFTYDVVLLDIMLPDGNGINLLKLLRKDGVESSVIIISAQNALDFKLTGLSEGADNHFTYPDVMVTCAPEDQHETRIVQHPTLLIEVLSDSTELRDRSWKLQQYQLLPSLRQYVLISQKRILVESYVLNERGSWELTMLRQPQDVLMFPSLQLSVTLAEVYEEVGLSPMRLAETIPPAS